MCTTLSSPGWYFPHNHTFPLETSQRQPSSLLPHLGPSSQGPRHNSSQRSPSDCSALHFRPLLNMHSTCGDEFSPQSKGDHETISLPTPYRSQSIQNVLDLRVPAAQPQLFGYLLMVFSALCHALMSFFVHLSETHFNFPTASAILVRGFVEITLASLYLYNYVDVKSYISDMTPSMTVSLVSRGLFGSTGVLCLVAALHFIAVGDAVTLFFCNPVITMALCAVFLKEPIGAIDGLSLSACFLGVVLVSQPTFIRFPWQSATMENVKSISMTGVSLALLGAFLNASAATVTRRMGLRMHFMINGMALSIFMLCIGIGLSRTENYVQLYSNVAGTLLAVLGSMGGFCSQGFMNKGLQYCRGGPGLLIRSLSIPFSYLLGFAFLGEGFSTGTLVGVTLVFASGAMIALREFLTSPTCSVIVTTQREHVATGATCSKEVA